MNRVAVLACITQLAACTTEVGPGDQGDLETIALAGQVPVNGIMFFPANLAAYTSSPLATQTFQSGPLAGLPFDEETRKFIRYTVECALNPEQEVKFHSDVYTGLLGECPTWNSKPPSTACLEGVTGCLLARQNAYGLHIPFSPRGQRPENPSFDPYHYVLANTYDSDPTSGLPISSFHTSCPGVGGEDRNCGWTPETALVGSCTPGTTVSVGAGANASNCAAPLGSASAGDMVLRVCEGMSGCNKSDPTHIGSANDACGGPNPALDFTCPSGGVFSVMLDEYKSGAGYSGEVGASSPSLVQFPDKESELFGLLEGSFYGNMFQRINPNFRLVELGPNEGYIFQLARGNKDHTGFGSAQAFPFEDAWCCSDPAFDPAYLDNARACAKQPVLDPAGNPAEQNLCMCRPLGSCNLVKKDDRRNRCMVYDQSPVAGDVDHDSCRDGAAVGRVWPMTTFLHDPCDMIGGPEGERCRQR